jgi:hypothetical protein
LRNQSQKGRFPRSQSNIWIGDGSQTRVTGRHPQCAHGQRRAKLGKYAMRWIPLVATMLFACGTERTDSGAPVDSPQETHDATTDTVDADPGPFCPPTVPTAGAPCVRRQVVHDSGVILPLQICEYGDDPHGVCRTAAFCAIPSGDTRLQWIVEHPPEGCGTPAPSCPPKFGDGEGTSCAPFEPALSKACDYAEGRCGCDRCNSDAGASGFWHCIPWTTVPDGCPLARPLLGAECAEEGKGCGYSNCCLGPDVGGDMLCVEGHWWVVGSSACSCIYPACPR